jgi:signal recognition particle receptor subunit beta
MFAYDHDILIAGPKGAGKTTAIRSMSDIEPISTEPSHAGEDASGNTGGAFALEYGQLTLRGGETLRLFGTPAQDRLDAAWEIFARGALGVIILIDHSRQDAEEHLGLYLEAFEDIIRRTSGVVGLTHLDLAFGKSPEPYYARLEQKGLVLPVLPVDPRRCESVAGLIDALLTILEARLDEAEADLTATQPAE